VRIVTPFAAGGNTDGNARIIAHHLGEAFGQQFIVDHRPGASGAIAAETVARSPADGYTLFLAALPQLTIVPALVKTSYDPAKDFIPISNVGTNPFVLVVHPGMPVKTLPEFIDHARRQNGKLAYAASGAGSLSHLAMALFVKRAGIEMVAVTYKGGAAPLTDVLAGHVPTYLTSVSGVLPHAMRGALRPIAISGRQRAPQMPDVPTFIESGFPGFNFVTWNGLLAPAGTPREIVERIAQEVARAANDPKVAARLAANGVDPLGDSPQEFAATIAADIAFWTEAVKISGVQEK
jgi:tripartite-type tricarboxylate transporter receptor subunit TctC